MFESIDILNFYDNLFTFKTVLYRNLIFEKFIYLYYLSLSFS
jgi:hypothetical protein